METQQAHAHHYVPQWYQKRFITEAGHGMLHLLDLKPVRHSVKATESRSTQPACKRKAPSRCFFEPDLYMMRFGQSDTDVIERIFFGEVDRRGSKCVNIISTATSLSSKLIDAYQNILPYMGAQRFRTPRGLDYLRRRVGINDRNWVLKTMRSLFQQHTTMWSEAVWEIVSAESSSTKFILSDEPVTYYNQSIPPSLNPYPGKEEIAQIGTRTLFALGPEACLILTHLEYVRNGKAGRSKTRENARAFDQTVKDLRKIQFGRQLSEEEVIRVNLILKFGATRYIAAGEKTWLYPERILTKTGWASLDDDWFLFPDPWKIGFSSEIIVGHNDGSRWAMDEYGYHPGDRGYKDAWRGERDWRSLESTKRRWAKLRFGRPESKTFDEAANSIAGKRKAEYIHSLIPKRHSQRDG